MQIIKYSKYYLITSLTLVLVALIMLVAFRLRLAVDFTGGSNFKYSLQNVRDDTDIVISETKDIFRANNLDATSARLEADTLIIQSRQSDTRTSDTIFATLADRFEGIQQQSFETVGSTVGAEMFRRSVIALILGFVGILVYIAYAFKNIPSPYSSFKFGISALLAMCHDVLIVFGVFALLGYIWGIEVDVLFITAILAVIGFSVNDTIVVFDRIRENLIKHHKTKKFAEIVNTSVLETIRRSLGTSLTVLVVLLSLLFFGGESIRYFILAMTIGVVVGTYSSIFVASPILVAWENYSSKKK
jgi:preprotein translocase subunit SecF